MHMGYFGNCQINLNAEKITLLPIYFCKRGGLTSLRRNPSMWLNIAGFKQYFLMKVNTSKSSNRFKQIFSLVNMNCRNVLLGSQKPLYDKSAQMAHFTFSMQNYIYYYLWMAVLIAVTKSSLIVKCGILVHMTLSWVYTSALGLVSSRELEFNGPVVWHSLKKNHYQRQTCLIIGRWIQYQKKFVIN